MESFLSQYDLGGKTVVPFNIHAGYGIGCSFETVKQLYPSSRILEGSSIKGGIERDGVYYVMEGEKARVVENEGKEWLRKSGVKNRNPVADN